MPDLGAKICGTLISCLPSLDLVRCLGKLRVLGWDLDRTQGMKKHPPGRQEWQPFLGPPTQGCPAYGSGTSAPLAGCDCGRQNHGPRKDVHIQVPRACKYSLPWQKGFCRCGMINLSGSQDGEKMLDHPGGDAVITRAHTRQQERGKGEAG